MQSELELEGHMGAHPNRREKEVVHARNRRPGRAGCILGSAVLVCNHYLGPWTREVSS